MTVRFVAPSNERCVDCKSCNVQLGYLLSDMGLIKKHWQSTPVIIEGKITQGTTFYKIRTITCVFCSTEIIVWEKEITKEEYLLNTTENQCNSCFSIASGDFYCIAEKGHPMPHIAENGRTWERKGHICGVKTRITDNILSTMSEGTNPVVNCCDMPEHDGDHITKILKTKNGEEFMYSWSTKEIQPKDGG